MKQIRQAYTKMDQMRVRYDFMYMMLSGKNEQERMTYLKDMINNIEGGFKETLTERGFSILEIQTLKSILQSNDPDIQDMWWFFNLFNTTGIKSWILNGDKNKQTLPPPIGNRDSFRYFIEGRTFTDLCESLLTGKIDVKGFAIGVRTEYAMTVGFVDISKYVSVNLQSQQ
jgi:hypothetical protein